MTRHQTFSTTLTLPDETEVEVAVTYTYYKGWTGDRTDPPEPASVEIQSVVPDVPEHLYDTVAEEAFANYRDWCEAEAEYRADAAREARWER